MSDASCKMSTIETLSKKMFGTPIVASHILPYTLVEECTFTIYKIPEEIDEMFFDQICNYVAHMSQDHLALQGVRNSFFVSSTAALATRFNIPLSSPSLYLSHRTNPSASGRFNVS